MEKEREMGEWWCVSMSALRKAASVCRTGNYLRSFGQCPAGAVISSPSGAEVQ